MKRNYLRTAAIVLIALPEPFTTPIGITLLLFSYMLPKRHKDSLRNLEELVRRYRNYTEKTGLNHVARLSKPVVFHQLNREVPSPQPNIVGDAVGTTNRRLKTSSKVERGYAKSPHVDRRHDYIDKKTHTRFQYNYSSDSHRVGDKIIHHVLRTSLPQYEAVPIRSDKVIHHTLKTTLQPSMSTVFYSRLQPIRSVTQPKKVVHHSLNRR